MRWTRGSYRWYLRELHLVWYPRGILDYHQYKFKSTSVLRNVLPMYIKQTRKLLDELEEKLNASESSKS